jgi:hypothetical protein
MRPSKSDRRLGALTLLGSALYMAAMIRSSKIVRPMTRATAMRRRRGDMAPARVRA